MMMMKRVRTSLGEPMSRGNTFLADQRGAASFEMMFIFPVLMLGLLLPLADVALAGFKYISAIQAMRAFGQVIQYSPPPDVTNTSSWQTAAIAKADSSYPISSLQLICGDTGAVCSSATVNAIPKYYSFKTTITLSPMVLKTLCPGSCTISLSYSERFQ